MYRRSFVYRRFFLKLHKFVITFFLCLTITLDNMAKRYVRRNKPRTYRRRLTNPTYPTSFARGAPLSATPPNRKRKSNNAGGPALRTGRYVRRRVDRMPLPETYALNTKMYRKAKANFGGKGLAELYKKVVGKTTQFSNIGSFVSTGAGKQGIMSYNNFSKANLVTMKSTVIGADLGDANFFLEYVKHTVTIRNQSNNTALVSVYQISTRRNTQLILDTPIEAWTKGYSDMGVPTQLDTPGNTPYLSPEFRRYFKVEKVTKVSLTPGQQHRTESFHKMNKLIKTTSFDNESGQALPGISSFIMYVWHGSIGHEALDDAEVTYMPIKLDVIQDFQWRFGWVPGTTTNKFVGANTLSTAVTNYDQMCDSGLIDGDGINA